MTDKYHIAVIAGDGIGKEVVPAACRVLDHVGNLFDFGLEWHQFDWGTEYYRKVGQMMPEDGLAKLQQYDAIFLGAIGDPSLPDHISLWGLLLAVRRGFRQYVNLRPVRLFDGIESPVRGLEPHQFDIVIVRENNEGEYSNIGGHLYSGFEEEFVSQESIFTRRGVTRIVRYACELAERRRNRLCSATKSNGIRHSMPYWDQIFSEVSSQYSGITTSSEHIDALVAKLILQPHAYDVIVASNLFGDIVSDLAAAVAGGIGMAPSANLNPEGDYPSMFEPVHGSAPDIAGKGIANPIGQIWSGALMLEHLGRLEVGDVIVSAIEEVLATTNIRTPDLGGQFGTDEVTDAIIASLDRLSA